ncbi:MAG TPA: CarD family transcriptional regulator [Anaerolineae bacterium]|nr:CarD family transcriptional regulator [Anaerolineae bacterium]HMR62718.1 CarD family transcriptional regulator [Anaerolineae bacterium]
MQLKIGDLVVHPAFGMGHIVDIEEKQFSQRETARLYYKVTRLKHTMWQRVEGQEAGGLRLVTAKSDLDQYRDLLKSPPIALNANHPERQLELDSRLQEGSFRGVCEVMRDLTAWNLLNPLGQADTTTLQKTRLSLYEEWATAADISVAEATKEINSLLQTTQEAALE